MLQKLEHGKLKENERFAVKTLHIMAIKSMPNRIECPNKASGKRTKKTKVNDNIMKISTYSHTSNTTCCNKSGNFCTIVTGWPDVKLTPYIGAVVLYLVLQRRAGVALHFSDGLDNERAESKKKTQKQTNRKHIYR